MKKFILFALPLLLIACSSGHYTYSNIPDPSTLPKVETYSSCDDVGAYAVDQDGDVVQCTFD